MSSAETMDLDKDANTLYPVHDIIRKRWSPRSFSDQPVSSDTIRQLFDAARWAPSSYNEQPWRFIYARKEDNEEYEKLSQVLNEYNQKWAADAPVLILAIVKENFSKNDEPNRVAEHDVGAAMAFLTFEATRHDIFVHQMAGILPDKAREIYGIPEGYRPHTMAAIGYRGDPEELPEEYQDSEVSDRSRKKIDDILFKGKWRGE